MGHRILLAFAFALLAAGCKRGEGEGCQSASDCEEGLVCSPDDGDRGFCQDPDEVDMTPMDPDAGDAPLKPDDAGFDDAATQPPGEDAATQPSEEDAG